MESTNEPNARRLFRNLREELRLRRTEHLAGALPLLPGDLRDDLETELERVIDGASFFQRENPFVRHVVLRKRATLEARGLLDKIAVNIHPEAGLVADPHRFNALFAGLALRTTPDFDRAYGEARAFGKVLAKRGKGGGFMKNLMEQRVCSSVVAGIKTATTLLQGRQVQDETEDAELELAVQTDAERAALESLIAALGGMDDDPKLRAIRYYLKDEGWLDLGCIIFSQYHDTARWVADSLAEDLPGEVIGLYAGADRSRLYRDRPGGRHRSRVPEADGRRSRHPHHGRHRRRLRGAESPDPGDPDQCRSALESDTPRAAHWPHQALWTSPLGGGHAQPGPPGHSGREGLRAPLRTDA
jgi:hypothetical protein